jgi:hypothetical protein
MVLLSKMEIFLINKKKNLIDQVPKLVGGAKRDRTADLLLARQALSQLSYSPI